jgi:uncharacterized protein YjbI with pentapeptide repeats
MSMKKSAPWFDRILTTQEKSELRGTVFHDREMIGIDLSGADLRDARFERVVLTACDLGDADLRGAHFVLCDLRYVVLTNAKLGDNRFYGTTLSEVTGLTEDDRLLIERDGAAFQPPRASSR